MMQAMALEGGALRPVQMAVPSPAPGEVMIRVAYSGINRADLLQLKGNYPKPEGHPAIPGMEVSGVVEAVGEGVGELQAGNKVCALLTEGGYAQYVCVPASLTLPVGNISLEDAAALPEACFTAWVSLVWHGRLAAGQSALIHGGTSGIGSIAIQIARMLGATVYATAGNGEKAAMCEMLGASHGINYKERDFVAEIDRLTQHNGVHVILDMVGGSYLDRNIACLAHGGTLSIIALLAGARAEVNMAPVLLKHLSIRGTTLRPRPLAQKAQLAHELRASVWPGVQDGAIKPVIDQIFPLEDAQKALARMDQGLNVGKILLKV